MLFVVLGLAMFDVVNIDFSRFSSGMRGPTQRGTFAVAFTMGAVAALLAGACVAPVVIQVVLFSSSLYASGTPLALALPFVLGLGMAIPWPIAGAGLAALPKPGHVDGARQAGLWRADPRRRRSTTAISPTRLFANLRVDAAEVSSSVQEKLAGRMDQLARGGARAGRRANGSPCSSTSGRRGARTA